MASEKISLIASSKDAKYQYEIDQDSAVGFYLIITDLSLGRTTADYLFEDLEDAIEDAQGQFGIDRSTWKPR